METLIGFGASSVEGVGDSQGGFFKRLESKLAEAGKSHNCLNYGIGGNSKRDMLARFDQVRPHLPCRSIVLLGSNDLPREGDIWPENRITLAEHSRNVQTLLRAFAGPETIFISSFMVCPQRTGIDPATFAHYIAEDLKIATAFGLTIWHLHAESLTFGDMYLAKDGLHFNDVGHEMIAEHIAAMILKVA